MPQHVDTCKYTNIQCTDCILCIYTRSHVSSLFTYSSCCIWVCLHAHGHKVIWSSRWFEMINFDAAATAARMHVDVQKHTFSLNVVYFDFFSFTLVGYTQVELYMFPIMFWIMRTICNITRKTTFFGSDVRCQRRKQDIHGHGMAKTSLKLNFVVEEFHLLTNLQWHKLYK